MKVVGTMPMEKAFFPLGKGNRWCVAEPGAGKGRPGLKDWFNAKAGRPSRAAVPAAAPADRRQ